jgi:DNA recombination-dependent growth factor C
MIGQKKIPKLNWTRINYNEENHDNRRLVEHRKRNCQCEVCFRELNKLPPNDPIRQTMDARKQKLEEREIKRAKKKAKLEMKEGKQACIRNFFRY